MPDLNEWAKIIAQFLKPKGKFVIVEFHPVVWKFDNDFKKVAYNYFNSGAIVETENGTYADKEADIKLDYVMWNHSLSEVINSLIHHDFNINSLDEFDYSPYNCFNHTIEIAPQKFRISHFDNKIPMILSISASLNVGNK